MRNKRQSAPGGKKVERKRGANLIKKSTKDKKRA